jgi:glycosyltransferase involved in cell wall biosynthesis
MKKIKLSVVLATYNEEKNIKECLVSLKNLADEIVVIDGSSTDRTVYQVRKFIKLKRKRPRLKFQLIQTSNKLMFHQNKQLGLEKAKGDWILQLDADERIPPSLRDEIKNKILKIKKTNHKSEIRKNQIYGFYIPRKNYFLGKWLRKGGQYPDYVIRLVRKGKAFFPCRTVHEQIKVEGGVGYLKNPLIHLAYPNLHSYFQKAAIYTSETALKLKNEKGAILNRILAYLVFKPIYTFFNLFLRHKGFVDGIYGFLFALFSALHFPWALIKSLKK